MSGDAREPGDLYPIARDFLRAGGRWSLVEFAALSSADREAAIRAGREHQVEMACMIGRAARGALGEAQVRAVVDDGEALEAAVAARVFERLRAMDAAARAAGNGAGARA